MGRRTRRHSNAPRNGTPGGKAGALLLFAIVIAVICWIGWKEKWLDKLNAPKTAQPAAPQRVVSTNAATIQRSNNSTVQPLNRAQATNQPPVAPPPLRQTNLAMQTLPPPQPARATPAIMVAQPVPGNKSAAVLDAQIALDRLAISPGSIDGVMGSQTRAAVRAFQVREGLPGTGELDTNTRARLTLSAPALTIYTVTGAEFERLHPVADTWLGKSEQERLDYVSLLEMVAERSHAHPNLVRRLNPAVDWDNVIPGVELIIPGAEREPPQARAAYVRIRLSERTLEAFDDSDALLAHFPCSIATRVEKRPVGELHVAVTAPNPNYTFDPEVFPESAEARELGRKLVLPPGPNNPVGTVWIGLDKPGYGIHGTPRPEEVGRTESHGCFRLANWNAESLRRLVTVGMPVRVEP